MPYFPLALIRNLRAARKAANLTQKDLAQKAGIPFLQYGRLERGEQSPTLDQLTQLAGVLGVSARALLEGCFPDEGCAPAFKGLADLAASCSQEGQRLIHDIAWLIAGDYDI